MDAQIAEICEDVIYLKNLQLSTVIGPDAWLREGKEQPVILSVRLKKDLTAAAVNDDVQKTINYGSLCKDLLSLVKRVKTFESLKTFHDILNMSGVKSNDTTHLEITTLLPKAMVGCDGGISLSSVYEGRSTPASDAEEEASNMPARSLISEGFSIHNVKIPCIIGVNPHERERKQIVVVNIKITPKHKLWAEDSIFASRGKHLHTVLDRTIKGVEGSSFETVESLAHLIASHFCADYRTEAVTVSVEKPSALAFVEGAGVEITRCWEALVK